MNKLMNKPEMEVVRFKSDDIIVASGNAQLATGFTYYTIYPESVEAFGSDTEAEKHGFNWARISKYSGTWYRSTDKLGTNANISIPYAWYNDGQWYTEEKKVNDYVANDGLSYTDYTGWRRV